MSDCIDRRVTRRQFGKTAGCALTSLALHDACSDHPLPLLVLLHGASGSGATMLRRLGAAADEAGIAVREFDGRHEVPPDIAREGMRWMTAPSSGDHD